MLTPEQEHERQLVVLANADTVPYPVLLDVLLYVWNRKCPPAMVCKVEDALRRRNLVVTTGFSTYRVNNPRNLDVRTPITRPTRGRIMYPGEDW